MGTFHVTGLFWYRFHAWGMAFLPSWGVVFFIWIFTSFFFLTLIKIRGALGDNAEAVLGPCSWPVRQWRILRSMHCFAWCLSERYERLVTDRRFEIEIDHARWERALAGRQGVILITAHIGNYEVGSMLPAFEQGRRVIVVREREVDPEAQQFVEQMLQRVGAGRWTNHFESDDVLHGMQLLHALREGAIVGIQGDRPRQGGRVASANLFGRELALPAGPAALARTAEVPLLPIFVLRRGRRRYEVIVGDSITVERSASRERDIATATQAVAKAIESAIRSAPHQWFCFRSLWPRVGRTA